MMRTFLFLCLFFVPLLAVAQKQEARPVVGKGVIFFGPSVTESDTINADNSEALGDFSTYTNKVVAFLQKQNIVFKYLSDRTIEIQYATVKHMTVCRDTLMFGTILTDGKHPPQLLPLVHTDEEVIQEVKGYFNIK
ncbi:MAG TPA: hypothetical protein VMU30_02405 [Bacteroidota bacterium]|nr:hypothetical protein [Bacteroidota bacterium]